MTKLITILLGIFVPTLVYGSLASDFLVNPQSTYAVPAGTTGILILDLTLPGTGLTSIKINNAGTLAQYDVSQIIIYEDGPSAGWDGDESEMARKSSSPFFDTEITGDFSKQRIFVTVDINSTTYTGKTIKPELEINSVLFSNSALNGPTDAKVVGFERMILAGSDTPSVPVPPMAKSGEALSASTIRWYFTDLANNEFGFKILDGNLNVKVRSDQANLAYIDETGLQPDTEYSGRQIIAFNDRGQSLSSSLTAFPTVRTLSLPAVEEPTPTSTPIATTPTSTEKSVSEMTVVELKAKIAEIQQQIIELLEQLIQVIQQQIAELLAR